MCFPYRYRIPEKRAMKALLTFLLLLALSFLNGELQEKRYKSGKTKTDIGAMYIENLNIQCYRIIHSKLHSVEFLFE